MLYRFDCDKYTYLLPPEHPDGQSVVTIGHCSKTESLFVSWTISAAKVLRGSDLGRGPAV